ncbi:FUSC family protein [Candidatus Binatia bacterium]|nr:FUSC family protein [Candidatus Binatia bacterium]
MARREFGGVGVWERHLFDVLREELAPTPARWRATLRISLAYALCAALIMTLRIPDGEFLIIVLFVVTQSDAVASATKAAQRMVGTLLGGGIGILGLAAFADKPWFLFPLQAAVVAVSIFLSRTTTAPYATTLIGITYLIAIPEYVAAGEPALVTVLWRIGLTTAGAALGTVAQLVLWPDHPGTVFLDELASRLARIERIVGRVIAGQAWDPRTVPTDLIGASGLTRQLDLLARADLRATRPGGHRATQLQLLTESELLLMTAIRVRRAVATAADAAAPPPAVTTRLTALQSGCRTVREAIEARRPAVLAEAAEKSRPATDLSPEMAAALAEMETALAQTAAATAFLSGDRASLVSPVLAPASAAAVPFRTVDCTLANSDAVHSALKAALAASIVGLAYQAMDWPEISTGVLTCLVVSQSTVGASWFKSLLRFIGSAIGGLLALLLILVAMPNMESVGSFVLLTTPLFGAAAWMVSGSSRFSYVGIQMAIALSLALVNFHAPTVALEIPADRVAGVLLGVVVVGVLDSTLWPVFARDQVRRSLVRALRGMADYHRAVIDRDAACAQRAWFDVHRDVAAALSLHDALLIEPTFRSPIAEGERRAVLLLSNRLQHVFVSLLALDRALEAIPAGTLPSAAQRELLAHADEVAARLVALANRIDRHPEAPAERAPADLQAPRKPTAAMETLPPEVRRRVQALAAVTRELHATLGQIENEVDVSLRDNLPAGSGRTHA